MLKSWIENNSDKFELESSFSSDETPKWSYYIVIASGDTVFLKASTRSKALALRDEFCTEWCGRKDAYSLRSFNLQKSGKTVTAR